MLKFIINKILIRSIVAIIGPAALYSLGFALTRPFLKSQSFTFFDPRAMIALLSVSIIYPLNKIGLMITLTPLEMMFDKALKMDNSKHFAQRGNYKPV